MGQSVKIAIVRATSHTVQRESRVQIAIRSIWRRWSFNEASQPWLDEVPLARRRASKGHLQPPVAKPAADIAPRRQTSPAWDADRLVRAWLAGAPHWERRAGREAK